MPERLSEPCGPRAPLAGLEERLCRGLGEGCAGCRGPNAPVSTEAEIVCPGMSSEMAVTLPHS